MLSSTLKRLVEDKLVNRKMYSEIPPRRIFSNQNRKGTYAMGWADDHLGSEHFEEIK